MAREKLTDKQKKKIIADYVESGNYSAVSRKYGVAVNTVKRIIKSNPDTANKVNEKKEENTKDVLSFIEEKKDKVCEIIEAILFAMSDKDKISKSNLIQLATTFGVIVDKYTAIKGINGGGEDKELKLNISFSNKGGSTDGGA